MIAHSEREQNMKHFFAPNEVQIWQNVQIGLVRPFGASQLILSEKNNDFFSLQMSSKLDKTFRTAKLAHLEHHSSFWARKKMIFLSLRMSSKLDKMFITAQLGHLEQYSSFWARKKGIFPLQMSSKLDKTFRTAKLGHLEHHRSF